MILNSPLVNFWCLFFQVRCGRLFFSFRELDLAFRFFITGLELFNACAKAEHLLFAPVYKTHQRTVQFLIKFLRISRERVTNEIKSTGTLIDKCDRIKVKIRVMNV